MHLSPQERRRLRRYLSLMPKAVFGFGTAASAAVYFMARGTNAELLYAATLEALTLVVTAISWWWKRNMLRVLESMG